MNLEPENRRSFVKKSLATSMTLTFAGLIRAHGNGSAGETTIDPENTYVTTNSGSTTTFDLEGTYYTTIGHSTTFDVEGTYATTTYEETTWNPEETVTTTPETTARKVCEWVERIYVHFNDTVVHPQPDHAKKSGRIFSGVLYCIMKDCLGRLRTLYFNVETGGYDESPVLHNDSDTGFPPGDYEVERSAKNWGGIPEGHEISSPPGRSAMLVHGPKRPRGSSGCIVITGSGQFAKWQQLMALGASCNKRSEYGCPARPSPVDITVRYEPHIPNYDWVGNPPQGANPYINPQPVGLPVPVIPAP